MTLDDKLRNLTFNNIHRILYTNTAQLIDMEWKHFKINESLSKFNYILFVHSDSLDPSGVGAYDNYTSFIPMKYFKQRIVGIADLPYSPDFSIGFRYIDDTTISLYKAVKNGGSNDNNGIEIWLL